MVCVKMDSGSFEVLFHQYGVTIISHIRWSYPTKEEIVNNTAKEEGLDGPKLMKELILSSWWLIMLCFSHIL